MSEQSAEKDRPYCLRCEAPIYRDERGVWRREATGVSDCPRNPGRDGHEPLRSLESGLLRERVREALADHFVMWRNHGARLGPSGEWFCACGKKFGFSDTAIDHIAVQVTRVTPPAETQVEP